MSLHKFAEQVAAQGRGDDSLLVHMTPDEVQRLQAFAEANGTTMTINPETGLPEAGFLSNLFKAVAPIALGAFLGPAGASIGGGLFASAAGAGLAVGGITTLATGSLSRGLMAGLGAYGGAGLGESLMNAGSASLASSAGATAGAEATQQGLSEALRARAIDDAAISQGFNEAVGKTAATDVFGAGAKAAAANPMAFAKQNLGNLAYAAAPIMAGAMVPTTTKLPEPESNAYIRQMAFNINPLTGRPDPVYGTRELAPVKASEWGDRTFASQLQKDQEQYYTQGLQNTMQQPPQSGLSSLLQPYGMATGGIVALAGGGVAHYENGGNVTTAPTGMSLSAAQADVGDIYRNVLGRDVDPEGLAYWSQQFATSKDPNAVYNDLLASAKQNTEIIRPNAATTFADASKDYTGYQSTDRGNIVDEWVRNNLGREPTDVDRQQQWYRESAGNMRTQEQAKNLYGQFKNYASEELGFQPTLDWMAASQLRELPPPPTPPTPGDGGEVTPIATTPETYAPPGTKNPYGNEFNPGDLTFNNDGTTTVTPNIPGRPYGGFTGMDQVRDAYTRGGGSLGYTPPVVETAEEHEAAYNRLTGDSRAAYNYLMGRGANPIKSGVSTVAAPYAETVLGKLPTAPVAAANTITVDGVKYNLTDPTRLPPSDNNGSWQWDASRRRWLKVATEQFHLPVLGQFDGSGGVGGNSGGPSGGSDGAIGTGGMGADGGDGAQSGGGPDNARGGLMPHGSYHMANGGMLNYAMGGGLGSLGGYSDGGRLLRGPGDGVSDSIPATIGQKQQPARLADGEFVVPARIVSELGNGSTEAGAKKLYAMMDRVQRARGKTTGKNKVAANSRADKYLPA